MTMGFADDSLQMILNDVVVGFLGESVADSVSASNEKNEEVREVTSKSAVVFLEKLKARFLTKLAVSKEIEKEFEAAVLRTWRKPLDLLDLLLYICLEVDGEFNTMGPGSASKPGYVGIALARLQANACLVFDEIVHLLKSGFPSGAYSRWKTLHEIACVSYFVSKHGNDVVKRFLDYEIVEGYFQCQEVSERMDELESCSISKKDFKMIERKFDKIRKKYGSDFVEKANYPYGWVPREIIRAPSLEGIEESVKLDMLRPFYRLVSCNVYGGPKGFMFRKGVIKNGSKRLPFPVGPSNYGLAAPGKLSAISLGQITACLLMCESTVKRRVVVEALRNLVDEICDAFSAIQAEFDKDLGKDLGK
jgi:hypothetical protein